MDQPGWREVRGTPLMDQQILAWLRVAGAILLLPFALYFMVYSPFAFASAVILLAKGNWWVAVLVLLGGLCGSMVGGFLVWLVRRLFRGKHKASTLTVLPPGFIQTTGLALLI